MRESHAKRKNRYTNRVIDRATKVMRIHPGFQRLNKEWTGLLPLELARLVQDILRAAPGHRNQRALARLLWRHIRDESSIRYYLRMLTAHEQTSSGTAPPTRGALSVHEWKRAEWDRDKHKM